MLSQSKKLKRDKKFKRYQRPIPGDRVQIDTCKIAPGVYQYTSVDDCSRWRVMELYKRRTASNTLAFIDVMIEQFPFPYSVFNLIEEQNFLPSGFKKVDEI